MAIVCKAKIESINDPAFDGPSVVVNVSYWFEDDVANKVVSRVYNDTLTFVVPGEVTVANITNIVKSRVKNIKDLAVASTVLQPYAGQVYTLTL